MIGLFSRQEEPHKDDAGLPDGVVIRRSARARRVSLRVDSKERCVTLIVPERTRLSHARNFAWQYADWIAEKLAELPGRIPFHHGTVIPVLGQDRRLHISYDADLNRTEIKLEGDELFVFTNKDDPSSRILRFLKNLARDELTKRAREKAARVGRKISTISIRDPKSRWGSCGPDGQISFSWRLVLAPYEAMDYVVAHEVAHLIHMDHSKAFWTQCAQLCDVSYMKGKKWMRGNGYTLHSYG